MSETVNTGCAGPAAPAVRLRRVIDVLGAGTAIFVSLPILLVIALAVWIEGGRPILYSQLRLGLNGAPFRMYKFRKFRADCDDRGSPLTMVNDNRMTTIGGLLAAFKLDELPQLWNILRGDMSFVGPRPETLVFADCFRNGFEKILEHRPGLVGPCQVLFRHENELFPPDGNVADFYREVLFPAKAKIDLAYYSNRTVTSDLRWIVQAGWIAVGEPLLNRMRRPRPESQSGIAPTGGSVGANLFQK
ncbi:sugar transferase [Bradyrhizobium barranii subsp. apii]|uniref:Sugar transferase n=1 Tax=Bradyrhizobium barranii subsp. apii TaxID=2819348 RepID=A0A8T5V9H0_9BRAD|nr:sugar transferase [Bradyrhizobium barranii]UPT91022.1 sugar transferase [Bradyrhizobium barranii subsp. apii]UPT99945.1 sugar transferase [Bradyrhizobium barranii subsp. apii]